MSLQRWREVEELYHSARESGEAVLADADPELQEQVRKLLAQDEESGTKLLDQRAEDLITELAPAELATGSQLGPYKIEASLGRGGMAKVFRATDTRLGRTVAIKISDERFSDRFEREAQAIAALNHPNICTLHDVGPNYLVMELVDGETLAARLKRGKLPLEQAVRFGTQIAEALAAAHAKDIIHADLKPANIMLAKSGVKVLDFGLAKSGLAKSGLAKSAADPSHTSASQLMGTPAYMAPEQFEGKAADARMDIYALGLVLCEMLTGTRSREELPPVVAWTVKKCLESDPDERWQSARDVKWALESATAALPASSRSRNAPLAWALGLTALLLAALGLAALAFVQFRRQTSPREPMRMSVLLPEKSRPLSLAVSPDGHTLAMVLVKEGQQQIWVRALDALDPTPLPGTDGATDIFWSPDSRFIAFFADGRLKKIERLGGPVQTLCDAQGPRGGSWSRNGDILFGGLTRVQRVSESGGAVSDLPNRNGTELFPFFLPDGRHYLSTRDSSNQSGIWLSSMDGPETQRILPDVSNAEIIDPPPGSQVGDVLFTRAGALMALPFDMKRLQPAGDPVPVGQRILAGIAPYWLAAAARTGVLAYVSGESGGWQYVWRDRQGKKLGAIDGAGAVAMISPDGKQLAGDRSDGDTWVLKFASGAATRLTFGPPGNFNPVWSPDGRYVAYDKIGVGIYRKLANGSGAEELLVAEKALAVPKSWSPDGRFLMYAQINLGTGPDLLAIPVEPNPKPFVVAQSAAIEDQGQFSPDGHWVAYTSNESGLSEIYVIPFPPSSTGGKWLVSRGGGVQPRWNRNGKELFYISPDSKMMAVQVGTQPVFHAGTPQALFESEIVDTGIRNGEISWDLAPDGNRFLIITPSSTGNSSLTVALNWRQEQ